MESAERAVAAGNIYHKINGAGMTASTTNTILMVNSALSAHFNSFMGYVHLDVCRLKAKCYNLPNFKYTRVQAVSNITQRNKWNETSFNHLNVYRFSH